MKHTNRTQADRIICHLATGRPVTPLTALRRWGCLRLGARIWELKRDGHRIVRDMVTRGGKTFASYRLERGRH